MAKLVLGNIKQYMTPAIVVGNEVAGKYSMLERIKTDSNVEIGTVCGFHTYQGNEYAVVCLDATYRDSNTYQWMSSTESVPGMVTANPGHVYQDSDNPPATTLCDKILAYAASNGYTSSAVTKCRSLSFVIDGITYYGQLPSIIEMIDILSHFTAINTKDPSGSLSETLTAWTSMQATSGASLRFNDDGSIRSTTKTSLQPVIPIIELPNADN